METTLSFLLSALFPFLSHSPFSRSRTQHAICTLKERCEVYWDSLSSMFTRGAVYPLFVDIMAVDIVWTLAWVRNPPGGFINISPRRSTEKRFERASERFAHCPRAVTLRRSLSLSCTLLTLPHEPHALDDGEDKHVAFRDRQAPAWLCGARCK